MAPTHLEYQALRLDVTLPVTTPCSYEAEAMYFDTHVREDKRAELQERLLALLQPPYTQQVAAHSAAVLAIFDRDLRAATSAEATAQGREASFVDAAAECRAVAEKAFAAAYKQHLLIPCGCGGRRRGG